MRTEPSCLQDFSDRTGFNQFSSSNSCFVLETLAVHYRVDSLCGLLYATHFCQLFKRSDSWLVRHVVLAMLHDSNSKRRAIDWDSGAEHKLDRLVIEHLILTPSL